MTVPPENVSTLIVSLQELQHMLDVLGAGSPTSTGAPGADAGTSATGERPTPRLVIELDAATAETLEKEIHMTAWILRREMTETSRSVREALADIAWAVKRLSEHVDRYLEGK